MDNDSTKEYNLILSLSTCPFYEGDTRIKLVFYNIQDFKLGDINNFYKVFFEITDVSGRRLENIRYYVNEIEYNMVSFWCSDIEYKSFQIIVYCLWVVNDINGNFTNLVYGNQKQSESTVKIVNELGLQPEYWLKYSLHPKVKKYIEI